MIRPATVDDASALGALSFAATHAGYAAFADDLSALPSVAEQVADWRRHLAAEGAGWTWLAEDGAAVVGLATAAPDRLDELMVLPDRFGRGIGRALLGVVEAAARDHGSTNLTLWTYRDNARARGFYERQGWVLGGAADPGRLGPQVRYHKALAR